MNQRRQLQFASFDDLVADLQHLKAGWQTVGRWSLGQICQHLQLFFDGSMNGFRFTMPWYYRIGAPLVLRYTLKKRRMPAGVKTPAPPPSSPQDIPAVDSLLETIAAYRRQTLPLHPSPLFGDIGREKWDQLHLVHCAHHLSFAIPTVAAPE